MWQFLLAHQTETFTILSILILIFSFGIYSFYKTALKRKQELRSIEEKRSRKQDDLRESIRIISMATIQGQCETSEACLRLANLLPLFTPVDPNHDDWQDLFLMYEDIRKLKTKEARSELKAQARHREDQVRYAVEEKYNKRIMEVCEKLFQITGNNI